MEYPIFYPKGTKIFCSNCGAHVVTMKIDSLWGEVFEPRHFEESEGQGPWKMQEHANCRECGECWLPIQPLTDMQDFVAVNRTEYEIALGNYQHYRGVAARVMSTIALIADCLLNKETHEQLTTLEQAIYNSAKKAIHVEHDLVMKEKERLENERT